MIIASIVVTSASVASSPLRVPQEHKTIQAAIDAAGKGDTIVVSHGKYLEHIRLKPGILLRSDGDETKGTEGLRRAEATIIDGGKANGQPGVTMAEGCTLDGFTITNAGAYDDATWKKHFDSHGEELGDEEGSVQAEGTAPAVRIHGISCTVLHCIVHHNGDVGIGILGKDKTRTAPLVFGNLVYRNMGGGIGVAEGAEPIINGNTCRENLRAGIGCRRANPVVTGNRCEQNIRAGIGCREGAKPVLRGNTCHRNRRAGIGIRMEGTAPIVESNECTENEMAGIGSRDKASPILRNNVCRKNRMAGIGCRDGAKPVILDNECRENEQAGIGVQSKAVALIKGNKCLENKLVAIGVVEQAEATITGNELTRSGGQPPIIAVKEGSNATIMDNRISGGGVAAVLVQGKVTINGNTFTGAGPKQGQAVWIWEASEATVSGNSFDSYRSAVNAKKATVTIVGNTVRQFQSKAIIVAQSARPAHVFGNTVITDDPTARVVEIEGPSGMVGENVIKPAIKK